MFFKRLNENFGSFGRKVYLENIAQSFRSRFYHHPTKTLVVGAYPLSDFNIVADRVIRITGLTQDDPIQEKYERLCMVESSQGLTVSEVESVIGPLGKSGLRGLQQTFKNNGLESYVQDGKLFIGPKLLKAVS